MWWHGCNKLALALLDKSTSSVSISAATVAAPAAEATTPLPSPRQGGPPKTPPGKASSAPAPGAAGSVEPASTALAVIKRPDKGWLLSHGITCGCSTADGQMQV